MPFANIRKVNPCLHCFFIFLYSFSPVDCVSYIRGKIRIPMHDDVIKWKHFPRNWPFVRGIHRSAVDSPHKGQWRGPLMFSLICVRMNGWVNNGKAGDLRRHRTHYDVTVMVYVMITWLLCRGLDVRERPLYLIIHSNVSAISNSNNATPTLP